MLVVMIFEPLLGDSFPLNKINVVGGFIPYIRSLLRLYESMLTH